MTDEGHGTAIVGSAHVINEGVNPTGNEGHAVPHAFER